MSFQLGDINGDNNFGTGADLVYFASHIANLPGYTSIPPQRNSNGADLNIADLNNDGQVGAADLVYLASYVAGLNDYNIETTFQHTKYNNIEYKPGLVLDAYIPNNNEIHTGIIYIHGGSFISGDEENYVAVQFSQYMASRGYAVFSVQYTLAFNLTTAVIDAFDALNYVKQNYNINEKLFIAGYSAGAITALYMSISNNPLVSSIHGIISLAGSLYNGYQNITLDGPEIMIWHGTNDNIVSYSHANNILNHCNNIGKPITFYSLQNYGHFNTNSFYLGTYDNNSFYYSSKLFIENILNPEPDFELLYSSLDDSDYQNNFNSLNSSDNWNYYNPNKNSNFHFALVNRTQQNTDKLVVLKIDKRSGQVTTCNSTTSPNSIYWNAVNSNSIWLDIKVIYTNQGDYAYMCTEGSNFGSSNSAFNNRVVHIYKLDTLYENETYSCVNTIPAISYHNLQVFQNNDVAYLYGVGGNRNALEIYDLSIDPEKPFYLGGYIVYPDGYNHSHEGSSDNDGNQLYIHDMQVSDQIEGQPGKIIGFLACIYNSTIVVVDLTNPLNINNIIIIDDPRFKDHDNYGLHHCWLTPNNEFLITATEANSNKTWVIDIKSIFEDGLTELLGNSYTKYIGQFQLLTDNLGNNLHNQYCYKIKDDNENFIILTAAYISGTHVHVINYDEIRGGLLDLASNNNGNNAYNNLQDAIISDLRLKESYESDNAPNGQDGVWSVSYCPNTKIVFDSCYYNSSSAKGFRVFRANAMPEVENDRQVPAFYDQITDYSKKLVLSKDPLTPVHSGFFRAIIRNPEPNYKYVISAYDEQNNMIKNGLLYDKCQLDLGHFSNNNMSNDDIFYTIIVKEYDENNNETTWNQSQIISVEPHMYMAMNEYTTYNEISFNNMHPPITMPIGYDISFSYTIEELLNPETNVNGYKINLTTLPSSSGIISFEELSLYNDPGWVNNSSPQGKFSCHSHYYVWEYITGQDSQGTVYDGYHWVKKGRMFENNWIEESKIKDKFVKIRFSSNNHGTISNSDNSKVSTFFPLGNPNEPTPE
jgi:acetyl esterase/lipase